jgi:hydrogenase maturation protease
MHDRRSARLLCLGNDLLADDAFGYVAAEELRRRMPADVEVVFTANTGIGLIDHLGQATLLVVVDTVVTGRADPGTIFVVEEGDLSSVPGGSPHYVGLFETLALRRALEMATADRLVIIAVEASGNLTLGGEMHPAVRAALPVVVERVTELVNAVRRKIPCA